ncbi:MAG: response regulator, partial [Anaerolineales bacterium]
VMRNCILVIDDEEYIRRMIGFVLEGSGFDVIQAASTKDGLEIMRTSSPDVITLDLMMPDQSGLDLLASKQADPKICDIPAIIITAVGFQADLDKARQLGASATLNKPFSQRQLVDTIRSVLDR